jgi:hypothetical protein
MPLAQQYFSYIVAVSFKVLNRFYRFFWGISGVMVGILSSSPVNHGFNLWSGQAKVYEIVI